MKASFKNVHRPLVAAWLIGLCGLIYFAFAKDVWYDDACHYLTGYTLATTGIEGFPNTPHQADTHSLFITVGPAVNYPLAGLMCLLSADMLVARAGMVLYSAVALLLLGLLGRLLFRYRAAAAWAVLLLGVNVQFLTYGSQYLGEGGVVLGLLAGSYGLLLWHQSGRAGWWLLGLLGFWWAILSKEYVAAPLGLALLAYTGHYLWHRLPGRRGLVLMCLLLPLASVVYYTLRFDSWVQLTDYWALKSRYSEEFWVWNWPVTLHFLAGKPLIWLGTAALTVRVRIQRRERDMWLLLVQTMLLLWYLAGIGYDRFGMLLLPIPALYVAEWLAAIWRRLAQYPVQWGRTWRMAVLALAAGLFFAQRTPLLLLGLQPMNEQEDNCPLSDKKVGPYFTYDLQVVPHLMNTCGDWRLPVYPPSSWQMEPKLQLKPGETLLYGPYAETEYFVRLPEKAERCGPYYLYQPR